MAGHGERSTCIAPLPGAVNRTASAQGDGGYRDAVQRLSSHQKTSKGAPAYSRFVNRRLGRQFAALAYAMGLAPNQVTFLSALCTFSAIAGIPFASTFLHGVTIGLVLLLGYGLDSADGQLARLQGSGSPAGEWLDHVLDSAKTASIHLAVLLHLHRQAVDDVVLLLPLAFAVVGNVWFFTVILTGQLRERHAPPPAAEPAGLPAPVLRSLLVLPTDYGLLCVVLLVLALTPLFLWAYGLLLLGCVLFLVAALPTWFREMRALPAATVRAGAGRP